MPTTSQPDNLTEPDGSDEEETYTEDEESPLTNEIYGGRYLYYSFLQWAYINISMCVFIKNTFIYYYFKLYSFEV